MSWWSDIEDAIQAAVVTGSGLPSTAVNWKWQNINQPATTYAVLGLTSPRNVGQDWIKATTTPSWAPATVYPLGARVLNDVGTKTYRCTQAGTSANAGPGPTGPGGAIADNSCVWAYQPPGQEIELAVRGNREVTLTIEVYTAEVTTGAAAIAVAEQIRSSLVLPSIRGALGAAGVVPFDPQVAQFMPSIVSVGFRGRAVLPIRCYIPAPSAAELTGFIERMNGTATNTDDGSQTSWTAP